MSENNTSIEINDLTKRYGDLTAVNRLTLSVPSGVVFGFLGPNGAGKTTTIRLLLGLTEPDGGSASIFGYDSMKEGDKIREFSGALLENHGLYEKLSALENLNYYADIFRLSPSQKKSRARELLEMVDLWERRNEKVKQWSRGMKQKLALVRSFLHRPRLLFMDEPTLGLDVSTAVKIREIITRLAEKEGRTVFLTSHNMAEVEKICDEVAIIRKGELVTKGSPEELTSKKGVKEVRITLGSFDPSLKSVLMNLKDVDDLQEEPASGDDGDRKTLILFMKPESSLDPVIRIISESDSEMMDINSARKSLETVFMELTEEEQKGSEK